MKVFILLFSLRRHFIAVNLDPFLVISGINISHGFIDQWVCVCDYVESGEHVGGKNIYKKADNSEFETKGRQDGDSTEMSLLNSNGQQADVPLEEVSICFFPSTHIKM